MIRDLICKRCLAKTGEEQTKKTSSPKKVKLCKICKEKSIIINNQKLIARNKDKEIKIINSNRMKIKNPMHIETNRKKVSLSLKKKYKLEILKSPFQDPEKLKKIKENSQITPEGRKRLSEKMKLNNPMYIKEYREKSSSNFKKRVKEGKIIYKKGHNHHLWKGNRNFNDSCRTQLYKPWIFKILKRDNFTCTYCYKTNQLQVHHLKPLREFIFEILQKYKIKSFSDIEPNEWFPYIMEIVENHKLEDGITLCESCHELVDVYYNKSNKENK
jgi:hypothetical protein